MEPLPSPVAGPVLMLMPTREFLERTTPESNEGPESMRHSKLAAKVFKFHTDIRDDVVKLFPRLASLAAMLS